MQTWEENKRYRQAFLNESGRGVGFIGNPEQLNKPKGLPIK